MLKISKLFVERDGVPILNGLSLNTGPGELHIIMGPNGSGKSTLAGTISGDPTYNIVSGTISSNNRILNEMSPTDRAHAGIFVSYQHPVSIPGLSQFEFLRTIYNVNQSNRNQPTILPEKFLEIVRTHLKTLGLNDSFLSRAVNDDFSGGEQKRNELLQMLLLSPTVSILDELDSGLDADGLDATTRTLFNFLGPDNTTIAITHNASLYQSLPVTAVHILNKGKIIKSEDKSLLKEIENYGYSRIKV